MIITKTPFRISFFGGGTDFPAWYRENGGAVLSTSIDKYCYLSCRYLPPFFDYKYRIVYSRQENVSKIDEIGHPAVRGILNYFNHDRGLIVHHDADLPARSGLGTSSSFTVCLLHNMYARKGKMVSKRQLAEEAIHIEQKVLNENVGSQDQVITAYGGFNRIDFGGDREFDVTPVTLGRERSERFQDHLLLFFTGVDRIASQIEGEKIRNIPDRNRELKEIHALVDQSMEVLGGDGGFADFGKMLHEYWRLKKALSTKTSNTMIDDIYDRAMKAGALGGKILGAGSGGFILFFVEPDKQPAVRSALSDLLHVPFRFDTGGSQVIYYNLETEQYEEESI
jgi:D-glycero-alpha-D-manno-heptose-7-phosphate kinase